MSESKVSCPHCGQHILLDDTWAGKSLNCPACQQLFTVPIPAAPTPAGLRLNQPSGPPPGRPPAATRSQPARRAGGGATRRTKPGRTSGLAIASLVLSLLGCLSIGGVICGHLARRQIRRDPSVGGNGLALAGLIIGYIGVAITAAFLALTAYGFVKGRQMATGLQAEIKAAQARGEFPMFDKTNFVTGNPPMNAAEEKALPVPNGAVHGTISGSPFTYTRAKLDASMGLLEIDEQGDSIANQGVKIFLFPQPGESLANRTWKVTPGSTGMTPNVHYNWKQGNRGGGAAVTRGYTMELTTGDIVDGTISGTLSLKIAGKNPVDLTGKFAARVR